MDLTEQMLTSCYASNSPLCSMFHGLWRDLSIILQGIEEHSSSAAGKFTAWPKPSLTKYRMKLRLSQSEDSIGVFNALSWISQAASFSSGKRSNDDKLSIYSNVGLFNIFQRICMKSTFKTRKHQNPGCKVDKLEIDYFKRNIFNIHVW